MLIISAYIVINYYVFLNLFSTEWELMLKLLSRKKSFEMVVLIDAFEEKEKKAGSVLNEEGGRRTSDQVEFDSLYKESLIESNHALVVTIANRYRHFYLFCFRF